MSGQAVIKPLRLRIEDYFAEQDASAYFTASEVAAALVHRTDSVASELKKLCNEYKFERLDGHGVRGGFGYRRKTKPCTLCGGTGLDKQGDLVPCARCMGKKIQT